MNKSTFVPASKKTVVLLVMSLVLVLSVAVYYAYAKSKSDDQSAVRSTQNNQNADATKSEGVGSFSNQRLEDVGVEVKMPESFGVLYTQLESLQGEQIVAFSTQSLAKAEPGMYCPGLAEHTGANSHLGIIVKDEGVYPGADRAEGELVKQFDTFNLQLLVPDASCFKNADAHKTASEQRKVLVESLKAATKI